MQLRLLTYNIHKGIGGVDRRYRPERIVEAIAHCAPDIVFLQEVDEGVPRSSHDDQVKLLGDALEMPHRAYQRNVVLKVGHYGNAILSRFPLSDIEHLDLTVPLKKRRQVLAARCKLQLDGHSRSMVLLNCHLGLAGFERKIQLRRIVNGSLLRRTRRDTPTVVGGDFNDVWGSLGRSVMEPAGFASAGGLYRTFPAILPIRPLDRIFFRGNLTIDHAFASKTKVARQASDHLPLVAVFTLS